MVLVIDDDRDTLDKVTAALSQAKIGCCCCTTPEEALAAAEATPPDLVLCNVNLHGHSGLEICQRIRQRPGLGSVPLMFLSGTQLPDIVRRSHEAGASNRAIGFVMIVRAMSLLRQMAIRFLRRSLMI